jgi:TonB family protein
VLLGAAAAVIALLTCETEEPTPVAAQQDAGQASTGLVEEDLQIPDELIVDAGPADAGTPPATKTKIVYVRQNCTGDIPGQAVQRVVSENRRQVRNCYERALKSNHTLQGTIVVQMQVGAAGQVVQSQVSGSLRDPAVSSCVQRLANTWRFPAPTGGNCVLVSAPFSFTPQR